MDYLIALPFFIFIGVGVFIGFAVCSAVAMGIMYAYQGCKLRKKRKGLK